MNTERRERLAAVLEEIERFMLAVHRLSQSMAEGERLTPDEAKRIGALMRMLSEEAGTFADVVAIRTLPTVRKDEVVQ